MVAGDTGTGRAPAGEEVASIARRKLPREDVGYFWIVSVSPHAEALHDTGPIRIFAILTHFPFAFEPRNGKAETDDATQHGIDVGFGRIGERPRPDLASFLLCGHVGEVRAQPFVVIHDLGAAI